MNTIKRWLIGACIALGALTSAARAKPPNVVLLVADDMRPDCIGVLCNNAVETPHLDALTRQGTAFTRASCAYPLCVPSRAELLTGCTTFRNGVGNNLNGLDTSLVTWPQAMRRGGYRTFYTGKWHTRGRPSQRGYDESVGLYAGGGGKPATHPLDHAGRPTTGYTGWVFQTDDGQKFPERGIGLTPDISAAFADAAIEVIARRHEQPFFLHVNFTAPHDPRLIPTGMRGKYRPEDVKLPPNFRREHPFDHGNLQGRDEVLLGYPRDESEVRAELAAYHATITHLDRQVGRILAALDEHRLAEETLVIFTADHGLALGSHGLVGKQNMYEHTINVPLVFRGPGIAAGKRLAADGYLRDLFPTVCKLAGVVVPDSLDGRSLAPVLRGEMLAVHPFAVGYFHDFQRMIRTERWKLVRYPHLDREQLFDLSTDPDELRDLAGLPEHRAIRDSLRGQLNTWLIAHGDPLAKNGSAKLPTK